MYKYTFEKVLSKLDKSIVSIVSSGYNGSNCYNWFL
jgi:hypothetical protein